MKTIVQNIHSLQLDKRSPSPIQAQLEMTQGDNESNQLIIKVFDGNDEIAYSTLSAAIILFAKPDKTLAEQDLVIDLTSNSLNCLVKTNSIAAVGTTTCAVVMYNADNTRLTSNTRFTIKVIADPMTDHPVESTTEYDSLILAIGMLNQVEVLLADFPHIKILGTFPTLADLNAAYPDGSALEGGFMVEGAYYGWAINRNAWESYGDLEGPRGYSPYELAVQGGFVGSVPEWLASLNGPVGATGDVGATGAAGQNGEDGITPIITIGEVENLAPGSSPHITRRAGSPDTAPIFDAGLVRGRDGTGTGDMTQVEYGGSAPGIVAHADLAKVTPWAGITDKPSAFSPTAHQHNTSDINAGTLDAARLPLSTQTQAEAGTVNSVLMTPLSAKQAIDARYTEGTFLPTLFGSAVAGTPTYARREGGYYKIGRLVVAWLSIEANISGATGMLCLGGFPFPILSRPGGTSSSYFLPLFINGGEPDKIYLLKLIGGALNASNAATDTNYGTYGMSVVYYTYA